MNPNAKQLPIDHLDDIVGSIVSTKDAAKRPLAYGALVRKALLWMKRPKDVLCSSADTFVQRSHDLSTPEYIVAREGVKIYG